MLNVRTIVLGATPIRTTSRRRRLFPPATQSQLPFTPPAQTTNQNAVDINARPGTMVFRIEEHGHANSGKTGVILRATAGPSPTTLDVLWTSDGTISTAIPSKLRTIQAPQRPALAGTTTPPPTATSSVSISSSPPASPQQATTQQPNKHGYKAILRNKLPKHLRQSCPLDSVSPQEIELFQIRMDNFLSAGHPRIRQLIMGKLDCPLLDHTPYIQYMERHFSPEPFVFDHAEVGLHLQQM